MRNRPFRHRDRGNGGFVFGAILLIAGAALLAREFGLLLPEWLFKWEMLLIVAGVLIGFLNGFRDLGWLIMIGVGVFFMADEFFPDIRSYIIPAVLILIGTFIILKPRKRTTMDYSETTATTAAPETPVPPTQYPSKSTADVIDIAAIFGGVKRSVLSKNFKGGEIVSVFGGADVNLTQADFQGPVRIEITAIFGGTKLIVPANWEVRPEATAILGGIDDKRDPSVATNPDKTLIIDGTVMFGGIEINSY